MIIPDMITHTLNILNQKYGLDVKIEKVEDSRILPSINKRMMTIRYNERLLPLFILYRMGNADLVIKYFLTHKYMSYNMYNETEHWLERTEIKAKKVLANNEIGFRNVNSLGLSNKTNNFKDILLQKDDVLMYQQLFVLLHEYSHGLFHKNEKLKTDYFDRVRKTLEEFKNYQDKTDSILNKISSVLPWGTRSYLMEHIGYGFVSRNLELINGVSADDRKIEEFASDLHAWHILASILHYGGYSLEEQIAIFTNTIEALYYLESYKALDDSLSYKVDMSKAENIALFDSMRYSILTYTIVLYLEEQEQGLGIAFDKQFSIFRWDERKEYTSLINKFVPLTKDLENGALIPDKDLSIPLYKKICSFEDSLIASLIYKFSSIVADPLPLQNAVETSQSDVTKIQTATPTYGSLSNSNNTINIDEGINKLLIELKWKSKAQIDVTAFLLGEDGLIQDDADFVFYNSQNRANPDTGEIEPFDRALYDCKSSWLDRTNPVSTDGSVIGYNKNVSDEEEVCGTMSVNLTLVNPAIKEIIFCLSIYEGDKNGFSFNSVGSQSVTVYNAETKEVLFHYTFNDKFIVETAIEVGKLIRKESCKWAFKLIEKGYKGGLETLIDNYA